MPEYLAPGVFVEEISIASKSIEGVGTSCAGFVGETERGPVGAGLVTSFAEYEAKYGGLADGSYMAQSLMGFFVNGGRRCFVSRVVGADSRTAALQWGAPGRPASTKPTKKKGEEGEEAMPELPPMAAPGGSVLFEAAGPGEWGNAVAVQIADASEPGLMAVKIAYYGEEKPGLTIVDPTEPMLRHARGRVEPTVIETYDNLSWDPRASNYCVRRVNAASRLVKMTLGEGHPSVGEFQLLSGGSTVGARLDDYRGEKTAGKRTGLAALADVDEVAIVCAPNHNDDHLSGLDKALVQEHCEMLKDRVAVLCAPSGATPDTLRGSEFIDSSYAALYYPWLKIQGAAGPEVLVPPVGHVAGIYARSDTTRGVHKAPANEVVRGVTGLELNVSTGDQEILNPRRVNCIRVLPGRGMRVWGARTMSSDPEWKYLNVRRLMLFLEESIDEATQWVVFEPNDRRLWSRVRQSITEFLRLQWRNGALVGATPEQAFFVRCDETTMTQNDIDNGRLIALIGVAPSRPAEFVIFRIAQWKPESE